jgi:hypothetical protein
MNKVRVVRALRGKNVLREMARLIQILLVSMLLTAGCTEKMSPEQRAIELTKGSWALGDGMTVAETLDKRIQVSRGDWKPMGWQAKKQQDGRWIVSYRFKVFTFDQGAGERAYYFQVDLEKEAVRDVTSDWNETVAAPLPAFKDEKEVASEFVNSLREEELFSSGR